MRRWTWSSLVSGNGLLPVWHQAITWTNADSLSTGLQGTNFSEIWIRIPPFSFKKIHLKMLSGKMAAILCRGRWVQTLHEMLMATYSDSKVHMAHMGPTWVLSAPGGPHVGPMDLAIRVTTVSIRVTTVSYPVSNRVTTVSIIVTLAIRVTTVSISYILQRNHGMAEERVGHQLIHYTIKNFTQFDFN